MSSRVWIDGKLVGKYDARISVFDHGLLFGDGVRAETRIVNGIAVCLQQHLEWMYASAHAMALKMPYDIAAMTAAVKDTIHANDRTMGFLRITVTRGAGTLGLDPRKCDSCIIIIAEDVMPYPREVYASGIDVITASIRRCERPYHTIGRSADVSAKAEALRHGCLDALLLNHAGEVTGFTDGICIYISNDVAYTSEQYADPIIRSLLPPIQNVSAVTLDSIRSADEVMLVGWMAEVIGVRSIDGHPIGTGGEGPITRRFREAFSQAMSIMNHHE